MSLNIDRLRDEFKKHLHWCEQVLYENLSPSNKEGNIVRKNDNLKVEISHRLKKMQVWSESFERSIESKVRCLERDLQSYELKGEYLRSITEGFDDLDRLRRTHKTLLDVINTHDKSMLVLSMKKYYHHFLIPLLNILAKLENDRQAILANKTLLQFRK